MIGGEVGNVHCALLRTGPGAEHASASLNRACEIVQPETVISAGYCGSLIDGINRLDIVSPKAVHSEDGNQISLPIRQSSSAILAFPADSDEPLISMGKVINQKSERDRLNKELSCAAVDMESHTLGLLCAEMGIGYYVVKIVTDSTEHPLPKSIQSVLDEHGEIQINKLIRYVFTHPLQIAKLTKLKPLVTKANEKLRQTIQQGMNRL